MKHSTFFMVAAVAITGLFTSCNGLILPIAATDLSLDQSTMTLLVGESRQMNLSIKPADATTQVAWISTEPTVAYVTDEGKVIATAIGTTTIVATADGHTAQCRITVVDPKSLLNATWMARGNMSEKYIIMEMIFADNASVNMSQFQYRTEDDSLIEGMTMQGTYMFAYPSGAAFFGDYIALMLRLDADTLLITNPDEDNPELVKFGRGFPILNNAMD